MIMLLNTLSELGIHSSCYRNIKKEEIFSSFFVCLRLSSLIMKKDFDIVIIGAGASGTICAAAAVQRGRRVAVLDHEDACLKKVKISGGGKCNFTNLNVSAKNYTSESTNGEIETVLKTFSEKDLIKLIKKHHINFSEKTKGQLFAHSSQEVIDALIKESKGVEVFLKTEIDSVVKKDDLFEIATNRGLYTAKSLVVATGGMSYQNIGASDLGYRVAKQFGLKIVPYKPALVPLNLDSELMKKIAKLKGISVDAIVKCNDKEFRENILFTHFGLSGPAVLQASLYWNRGNVITLNLLPDVDVASELKEMRSSKGKKLSNLLKKYFPDRLVEFIVDGNDIFISEASNKLIESVARSINKWEVVPVGTQGFKTAEVTSGGVNLGELDEHMEAKKVKGLFFIGEVVDVTGQLGGYNLQWAWSSGFVAGKRA